MGIPTQFDGSLISGSDQISAGPDSIMRLQQIVADVLDIPLSTSIGDTAFNFNPSTGLFEGTEFKFSADNLPNDAGLILTDTDADATWRWVVKGDHESYGDVAILQHYTGSGWLDVMWVADDKVYHRFYTDGFGGGGGGDEGGGGGEGGSVWTVNDNGNGTMWVSPVDGDVRIGVADTGIDTAQLATDAVTADKLAEDAVAPRNVQSGAITYGAVAVNAMDPGSIRGPGLGQGMRVITGYEGNKAQWTDVQAVASSAGAFGVFRNTDPELDNSSNNLIAHGNGNALGWEHRTTVGVSATGPQAGTKNDVTFSGGQDTTITINRGGVWRVKFDIQLAARSADQDGEIGLRITRPNGDGIIYDKTQRYDYPGSGIWPIMLTAETIIDFTYGSNDNVFYVTPRADFDGGSLKTAEMTFAMLTVQRLGGAG